MVQETVLISLPLSQLETLIDNCVSKAIRQNSIELKEERENSTKYLTRKETANKLHLSLTTLDSYVKNGIIPCHKIGHRVLFKLDEVNESLFTKFNDKDKTKTQ